MSAIAIGLSLGIFGSGGSIITVPALIYLFGQDEKIAIAGSLAIVGIIALIGSLPYVKQKRIDWRMVWMFGIPGMLGTYLGAWLSVFMSGLVQLMLFAVIMLLASGLMLRPLKLDDRTPHQARARYKIVIDGLVVGVITGLVGVGGGFLIVPALVLLGGLNMHMAVATSLMIVALKSFIGFIKYIDVLNELDLALDWHVLGLVSVLGVLGSFVGSSLAGKLPQAKLKKGFAIFLIVMGIFILAQSAWQLL
ncbi:MAG: sulfite exporter TauE/SafE family protein [Gammaproteobacteria bacterium]|nr:sulfite exporter TauE/SafE family protein [Gammaproteobacteria bacterium]NNM13053.1 sulfite exporter TauE/SafE family protein [Gammaproteobacteria bacterium]